MKQHKIGKVVVFLGTRHNHVLNNTKVGKPYKIAGHDDDGDEYYIDDSGERNFSAASGTGSGVRGVGIYVIGKLLGEK